MPDERELTRVRRDYADLFDEGAAPELVPLLVALEAVHRPDAVPDQLRQPPPWPGVVTAVPAPPVAPRAWQEPVRLRRPAFATSERAEPPAVVPVIVPPRQGPRYSRVLRLLLVATLLVAIIGLLGSYRGSFVESVTRHFGTAPIVAAPTPSSFPAGVPNHPLSYSCFSDLSFVPTTGNVPITAAIAEARQREGYDLPFREGRLGTLVEARLVNVIAAPRGQIPSAIAATTAASAPTGRAWLLAFTKTPALTVNPLESQTLDGTQTSFYYVLVNAENGQSDRICDGYGPLNASAQLPQLPTELMVRLPIEAAQGRAGFPAKVAGQLPFTPALSFGRINQLPDHTAEIIADYFSGFTADENERVRVISTQRVPVLATTEHGGETVALADGRAARFDDLQTLQVLTWSEGGVWYQIIAARPRAAQRPFSPSELISIAADLR